MIRVQPSLIALSLFAILLTTTSCESLRGGAGAEGDDADPVVARIGDDAILLSSIDRYLKDQWFAEQSANASALYELRHDGLDEMIDQWVLETAAEKAGMSPDEFIQAQVDAMPPITDEEVDAFYAENKSRIRGSDDMDQIREAIRDFLMEERPDIAVRKLRVASGAQILLEPPRWNIAATGVSRGPEDAPVTIIEFSDYQCPFCRRAETTIAEVEKLYPEQVRLVFRHFPLDGHPEARPAAEAAICAEAQGRFWEYHHLIFENQREINSEKLREFAKSLDLDLTAFDACLKDEATQRRIDADIAAARGAGASSTPTFFVNGRMLRGAKPANAFQKVIDEELGRTP